MEICICAQYQRKSEVFALFPKELILHQKNKGGKTKMGVVKFSKTLHHWNQDSILILRG